MGIQGLAYTAKPFVSSVNLVCKKELNLMLIVSKTSSQGAVGFELRGTDFFLPTLYDLKNRVIMYAYPLKSILQR